MGIPLAVQLSTVRREAAQDFGAVLERVAEIGYLGVELGALYGLHGMAPDEFRHRLDDLGLQLIGVSGPGAREWTPFIDEQEALGNEVIMTHLMPEHFVSSAAAERGAEQLSETARPLAERGMTLLYHNHSWEFRAARDGWVPFFTFLEFLDPLISLEPDTYWIKAAGLDPAEVLSRLGARVWRMHIKDGPGTAPAWPDGPPDVDPQLPIGSGVLDIPALIAAAPQVDWHVVEFDECASDVFDVLRTSYRFLTEHGLSVGRDQEVPGRV